MRATIALIILNACIFLGTCSEVPSQLDRVLSRGELRVVTRNSPTTYYLGPEGPLGPEYELARGFADFLGVRLSIFTNNSLADILPAVARNEVDFAAAGLTVTDSRRSQVRFTRPYQTIGQQLVYRLGTGRPRSLDDLADSAVVVMGDSSHVETLQELKAEVADIRWVEDHGAEADELIFRVATSDIDYTIADSNEFSISRQHYPDIRAAFDLKEDDYLAWAFPRDADNSLFDAAQAYLDGLRESGQLERMLERYYGHTDRFDYVGTRLFIRHIDSRLPRYRQWFENAGELIGIDWRLLAAVGYQESGWNAKAVSPTGVRGIMMLTQATARQLGIADRTKPRDSIIGGARYIRRVMGKIPDRIADPDRTWLTLAAYNVGFGHLEDARILAEINGLNPDLWSDVRTQLPLLTKRKWYSRTRHGYARGWEPVHYVDNIRRYHDILLWALSDRNRHRSVEDDENGEEDLNGSAPGAPDNPTVPVETVY